MNRLKQLFAILVLSYSINSVVVAESQTITPFTSGSYQQLLDDNADQAYVLVLWSITCSSCIKEMDILKEIHQQQPELKLVMLAVDDIAEQEEINRILADKGIADLESWAFADANAQRLRYQIDPAWYGEIPRMYFFDAQHKRQGFSGKMSKEQFLSLI